MNKNKKTKKVFDSSQPKKRITLNDENHKVPSFNEVKSLLDNITNAFTAYGGYLFNIYNQEIESKEYKTLMKESYLRNVRYVLNPTWNDQHNNISYPTYQTNDGLNDLFYMIKEDEKNKWLFQHIQIFEDSDQNQLYAFEALLNGTYHTQFMENHDNNYYRFTYYYDVLMSIFDKETDEYTKMIYHIGSLLHIDGNPSICKDYQPLEASIATKNMIMAIHSFKLLKEKKILNIFEYINIDDVNIYISVFLTPFLAACYAMRHLDMEDELIDIDRDVINKICISNPCETWIEEFNEEAHQEYVKKSEEKHKLRLALQALKEEERKRSEESLPSPIIYQQKAPEVLNKRFAELVDNERAAAAATVPIEVKSTPQKVKNSPSSSVSSHYTSKFHIPIDFVFEDGHIPKSMRRHDKSEINGRADGFLLFHAGTAIDTTYERHAIPTYNGKCCIKELCKELPNLLIQKERVLRNSRDKIFGKEIQELYQTDITKKTFYYTNLRRALISFCNEMSATSRFDNDTRMSIIEKYYGPRREEENEKMYLSSFMYDVFRPFVNFYTYTKNL